MVQHPIEKMKKAHEILAELPFEVVELERGYARRWLRIDLGSNEIGIYPITQQMIDRWTGGKGFDLWLTFQEIDRDTKWDSPNNPICFSPGPLGGTISFPGSGKTLVTAISPLTRSMMDCNVGGYFGPYLKFAGFDALMVTGKAKEDVIILINAVEGRITIERAPLESIDSHLLAEELTEMYSGDELDRRNIACVTAGRGAEHTRMGVLNFSFYDWRRSVPRIKQAGRGGVGTVFRDKNIKAIITKNRQITPAWRIAENEIAKRMTPKKVSVQTCKHEIETIHEIIERWNSDPEFVIEMMQDIQDRYRHISKTAIDEICRKTGRQKAHLYHIATFYKAFSLEPKGETTIEVCMGTACHVKGAARILDSFERVLGVRTGGTTPDNRYTLEAVACLGACSIAPVVKINEGIYGNVQAKDIEKLLAKAAKAEKKAGEKIKKRGKIAAKKIQPEDLDKIAAKQIKKAAGYKGMLMVCTGTSCAASKGFDIRAALSAALEERKLDKKYLIVGTGCNGFCSKGPIVVIQPAGIFYHMVREKDAGDIADGLAGGTIVERLLYKDPVSGAAVENMDDIAFFGKQQLLAFRNRGLIDPENIDHYIARGGYGSLRKALSDMAPEDVRTEVAASGLRGRGGGGFPTGMKWESAYRAAQEKKEDLYILCNSMERNIIDTDPHSVIEGMLIGAYALGAKEGHVFIRKEYPLAMERMEKAVDQCRAYGLLGDGILGNDFCFDIRIHRGAGAFVGGESSALMASIAGKPGEPRAKYVHSTECGFRDKPTVLNNVETWANIPVIIEKGASWFASLGTGSAGGAPQGGSSGMKVFTLTGDVKNTGLIEVPMGTTFREIIEDIGGGMSKGDTLKAVQTGGPSGGILPASMLDMPIDFDSLTEAGSIMGSSGILAMNERTCMVDMARNFMHFLMDESCGKCTPCREGLHLMHGILERICNGEGETDDIERLGELCRTLRDTSLCQLGGTAPNPVLSTMRYFLDEYKQHIEEKRCTAGVCKALIAFRIDGDACTGCTLCAKNCPVGAITGEPKKIYAIDEDTCIKCGICYDVCAFDAVEVE
jgi:NADH:ubiquinone oxidoreductase subunit F (NADH-binding)/NADH:ubiquinone oxidoreductase subunit E/NAD-dependent dihydropyrimidine dehydrogenase PreA subunit